MMNGEVSPWSSVRQCQPGQHGGSDADEVEAEDQVLPADGEEGSGEQGIDGKPGAAGHERGHDDGHGPVALVLQRPRRHDRWHVAAEADDERHEGLPRQADGAHEPVHNEGGPGHVAGVLQRREEQEQATDDRDEGCDRLDAAADAVGEHGRQPVGAAEQAEQRGCAVDEDRAEEDVEEVDEGAADVDGHHEHRVHDDEEDRDAERPVQHQPVNPVGQVAPDLPGARQHRLDDPVHPGIAASRNEDVRLLAGLLLDPGPQQRKPCHGLGRGEAQRLGVAFEQTQGEPAPPLRRHIEKRRKLAQGLLDRGRVGEIEPARARRGRGGNDRVLQRLDSLLLCRDDGHDRAAEPVREALGVDPELPVPGHVHHVQRDDDREVHLQELAGEVEVPLQVRGIDDVDDQPRRARSEERLGDALVERAILIGAAQGVGAGQVDDLDGVAGVFELAGLLLDRDARPVADPLARACQRIEQRSLAAVGIANQADHACRHPQTSSMFVVQPRSRRPRPGAG
jgi:hypothetical protein